MSTARNRRLLTALIAAVAVLALVLPIAASAKPTVISLPATTTAKARSSP